MAKLRSRDVMKQVQKTSQKLKLENNPNTPLGIATSLRTRGGSKDAGYINTLNRLQKKTAGQLKPMPGCGPKVKDWMTGYDD